MTDAVAVEAAGNAGDYCAPMRREDWAARLADTIAGEVRRRRRARGMTAQQVVDACGELGLPMKRTVLTNLENGRRGNVAIAELIAIAKVLRVTPLQLIFPVGRTETVEVLPEQDVPTWDALKWFTAEYPALPGETIEGDDWGTGGGILALYRRHDRLVEDLRSANARASDRQRRAGAEGLSEPERDELLRYAEYLQREAYGLAAQIKTGRDIMRRAGYSPLPDLPPELADLDKDDEGVGS